MDEKITVLWGLCVTILLFPEFTSPAVAIPPGAPRMQQVRRACETAVADIMFLLDESGSVKLHNFKKVKEFVIDIVNILKIGRNNVRIGVGTFSSNPKIRFHLNKHFNKRRIIQAINRINYRRGGTQTDLGLKMLRISAFRRNKGDRKDVPNIAIVVTDGMSLNSQSTIQEAKKLQRSGVRMFSIGIGNNLRESELTAMASKPTSEHKFKVGNFAGLKYIENQISMKTCEDSCRTKRCQNGGNCLKRGQTWKCICSPGFTGKYCQKGKDCYCNGYGDPHYKTFDGQLIHFMGICKYTLAASTKGAPNYFAIEVKNEHRGNNRVSFTRLVDIKLKGVTIRLMPGNKMLVNGEGRTFPIRQILGFTARYASGWITVTTSWGLKVQFDGIHRVNVRVRGSFANKLTGICGDCNGKNDDFRTKQGKDVSKYRNKYYIIGNSYRVKDDSDIPTTKCNVPDVENNCKPFKTKRCNLIKHKIFNKCIAKLGRSKMEEYVQSCRIDACVYRKNKKLFNGVVCAAIESFAEECAKVGAVVNWRRVAKCPKNCPPRQEYKFYTPICQPSCANPKPKCRGFTEGCVCRKGLILSGNKCVPKSKCGCFYRGYYMEADEDIIDSKCRRKTICKPGGALIQISHSCNPNGICTIQNGKRKCVCKKGFFFHKEKCILKEYCILKGCKNGGTCEHNTNKWKCICKPGYVGKYCETWCTTTAADIVFLLDDSKHILVSNSMKVKLFMKDIVTNFNIGANHIRVGSVSFRNWIKNNFHLNHHFNLDNLLNAIDAIKNRNRLTYLDEALIYLRTQSFTAANGDRVGIPNVLIMVTDGKPEKENKTLKAAKYIKLTGVIVFVIGVGKSVHKSDLTFLASEPFSEFVYTVDNFRGLDEIKTKITKRICSVSPCDSGPCKNGGKCQHNEKSYTCICRRPYSGKYCTDINPCDSGPCKNGGKCQRKGKSYTCICKLPYSGKDCTDINPCDSGPCKNDGQCQRRGKSYTCICRRPYSGKDCTDINPCDSGPCKNGGLCQRKGKSYTCICRRPYTGKDCTDINPCDSGPCKNGGQCQRKGKSYTCICRRPYSGKDCTDINPCDSGPCKNGGKCQRRGKSYTCICRRPYTGKDCTDINPCDSGPCKNGGQCQRKGKSYTCICRRPYSGKDCTDIKPCLRSPCKNGGTCVPYGQESFICACRNGFTGRLCDQVDICVTYPCKNGGTCVSEKSGLFKCQCTNGFIGIRCDEIDPCLSSPCKNGATCYAQGLGSYTCHCQNGFTGTLCNELADDCKCSAWGHLHYETFDGQLINFLGNCKYMLSTRKATSRLPYFAVEVKNELLGHTWVSYSRVVDVKINGATMRIWSSNKLSVNGEILTMPLKDYMGFSATYAAGWVTVTTNFGVQVVSDGLHRIYLKVPGMYREELTGLCGDCNGLKDDLKTKDGVDVSKALDAFNIIAKSCEVFDDVDPKQQKCKAVNLISKCTPEETKVCDRLKNPSGPFGTCLRRLGSSVKNYYKSCTIDICANKNLPKIQKAVVCQLYEALAAKCEELGILVDWRSIMQCPMRCSVDKIYVKRISRCQPTCLNPTPMCPYGVTEGCICKPGTILSGTNCVPMTSCGCTHNGIYQMANTDLLLSDCSQSITCVALNKIKKKLGCTRNCVCSISGGKRQWFCIKGYKLILGKCRRVVLPSSPSDDLEAIKLDPKVLDKFVRVFVAYLREKAFKTIHAKFPEICAQRCLKDKRCKSFNFNKLKESCELLSINAEDRTLVSSDNRYDDYYQLIGFKRILIRGAEIFSCKDMKNYRNLKTLSDCKKKCQQHHCKALEYSQKYGMCSITKSSRNYELMGDAQWIYYGYM